MLKHKDYKDATFFSQASIIEFFENVYQLNLENNDAYLKSELAEYSGD